MKHIKKIKNNKTLAKRAGWLGLAIGAIAMVAGAFFLLQPPPITEAASGDNRMQLIDTFYAYLKPGDTIQASASVDVAATAVSMTQNVTLEGPSYAAETHSKNVNSTGSTVAFANARNDNPQLAEVWTVKYNTGNDWDGNGDFGQRLSWDITVKNSFGTTVPGRVWAYSLSPATGWDNADEADAIDMTLYAQHFEGYLYKVTLNGHNGWYSHIAMGQLGAGLDDGQCQSAFASGHTLNDQFMNSDPYAYADLDTTSCSKAYRMFFEDPRGAGFPIDLNASNTDLSLINVATNSIEGIGKTTPDKPVIEGLTYVPSGTSMGSGVVTMTTSDYTGRATLTLKSIEDADGVVTNWNAQIGPEFDISGKYSMTFDATPYNIKPGSKLTFEARLTKAGMIHVAISDAEYFGGGIEIQNLNTYDKQDTARQVGDKTIYWNDSQLANTNRCGHWGVYSGSYDHSVNGVDSTGGVHWWTRSRSKPYTGSGNAGTPTDSGAGGSAVCSGDENESSTTPGQSGSWGNWRIIDNWAYDEVAASAQVTAEFTLEPKFKVEKTVVSPADKALLPDGTVVYQFKVTNKGIIPSKDGQAKAIDIFPSQLQPIADGTDSRCVITGQEVVCSAPALDRADVNGDGGGTAMFNVAAKLASVGVNGPFVQNSVCVYGDFDFAGKNACTPPPPNLTNCPTEYVQSEQHYDVECLRVLFTVPDTGVGSNSSTWLVPLTLFGLGTLAVGVYAYHKKAGAKK
jgi:hypothetical protein